MLSVDGGGHLEAALLLEVRVEQPVVLVLRELAEVLGLDAGNFLDALGQSQVHRLAHTLQQLVA